MASNVEKLLIAQDMGADHLIYYTEECWVIMIIDITDCLVVCVALVIIGVKVFHKTLDFLATFGRLVIYGAASREQAQFYPSSLMKKNQSVIGFFLPQIMQRPELLESSLEELLGYVNFGELELKIWGAYP